MALTETTGNALHVAWTLPATAEKAVKSLQRRLSAGQESKLFELQWWECREGRACAVLTLCAPLEEVVEVLWGDGQQPVALSFVDEPRKRPPKGKRCAVFRQVCVGARAFVTGPLRQCE